RAVSAHTQDALGLQLDPPSPQLCSSPVVTQTKFRQHENSAESLRLSSRAPVKDGGRHHSFYSYPQNERHHLTSLFRSPAALLKCKTNVT
ncbi:hypothetical protein BC936DRAFT_148345, partial [Jimgerdemannia flammicorona]